MKFLPGLLLTVAALFALLAPGAADPPGEMTAPPDLWRGYDPEALPLGKQSLRAWEEDGVAYEKLTFTGEKTEGGETRIFAIQGAPVGGRKLPGILHIHGGGQTASQDWVRYWAKRGYVAVTFDFCGKWEKRTEFTDWGPISQANMAQANGGFQVHPTPRESSWYHWAVAARRALTLLAKHPQVDPQRLGIFGVSVGGTLSWLVAAVDARVRTAVPIYGCGYNYDNRNARWGFGELSPDMALYKRVLSPEAHAPYVTCPVLFLSATNDFHGPMDYAYDTLGAVRGLVRQAFTPRTNHHLEPEQGGDLARWMDWQLRSGAPWPASPRIETTITPDGVPSAALIVDRPAEVASVEVYYALGDKQPQARFWRHAEAHKAGKGWAAALPVMDTWEPLFTFANVTYRSGVCLSSQLLKSIPAQQGKARPTLEWSPEVRHGRDGFDHWFYTAGYTDPNIDPTYLRVVDDGEGGRCLTLNRDLFGDPMSFTISTHIPSDPQFVGRDGMALALECRGAYDKDGLTVNAITHDWNPQSRTYSARVAASEIGAGWTTVVLPPSRFAAANGERLPGWKYVERFEIRGAAGRSNPPCFRALRWVMQKP